METRAGRSMENAGTDTLQLRSGGKSDPLFPNPLGPWDFGVQFLLHFQQLILRSH